MKRKEASRQKTDAQHGSQLNWERKWEFQHSKKVSLQIGKVNGVFCCLFGVRSQLNRKRSVVCPPPPFLIFPLCVCVIIINIIKQTKLCVSICPLSLSHLRRDSTVDTLWWFITTRETMAGWLASGHWKRRGAQTVRLRCASTKTVHNRVKLWAADDLLSH